MLSVAAPDVQKKRRDKKTNLIKFKVSNAKSRGNPATHLVLWHLQAAKRAAREAELEKKRQEEKANFFESINSNPGRPRKICNLCVFVAYAGGGGSEACSPGGGGVEEAAGGEGGAGGGGGGVARGRLGEILTTQKTPAVVTLA